MSLHLGSGVGTGGKEMASQSHAYEDPGSNLPVAGLFYFTIYITLTWARFPRETIFSRHAVA